MSVKSVIFHLDSYARAFLQLERVFERLWGLARACTHNRWRWRNVGTVGAGGMSAIGVGCVETLRQGARIVALAPGRSPLTRRPAGRTVQFFAYILIAARSGLTPMMFMTRVRL